MSTERPYYEIVNASPILMSLLYDLDLMPEQLEEGSRDWNRMMLIIRHWEANDNQHAKNK